MLLEQIWTNEHAIKIEKGKKQPYELFYSLGLVELEILKPCMKTNLAINFISASKLLANALIFSVCKPNSSLYLCVNYQKLNNFKIKNWNLLPLIGESLNRLVKLNNLM